MDSEMFWYDFNTDEFTFRGKTYRADKTNLRPFTSNDAIGYDSDFEKWFAEMANRDERDTIDDLEAQWWQMGEIIMDLKRSRS